MGNLGFISKDGEVSREHGAITRKGTRSNEFHQQVDFRHRFFCFDQGNMWFLTIFHHFKIVSSSWKMMMLQPSQRQLGIEKTHIQIGYPW